MIKKITIGVSGLHCASCVQIITKELKTEPALKSISINPLTEQAELEIDTQIFQPEEVNARLKKLGYHFDFPVELNSLEPENKLLDLKNKKLAELSSQKNKLRVTLPLMSFILLVIFWSLAAQYLNLNPKELIPEAILLPIVFATATLVIFWVGRDFLKGVWRFIRYGRANMDTLIGLGTGAAYFYSTLIYLFPTLRQALGLEEMYFFDVTIVVITLVYLGKYLENKAKLRTNEALEKLVNLQTKTALVEKNGQEIEIPLAQLQIGDLVIVKPGMKIPADGEIISGSSAIDESLLTGESLPVDKNPGDLVIGTTLNKQGVLKIKITKVGAETVLATIIRAMENAQNSKAPIQKLVDQVAGIFVPIVLALAALTLIIWLVIGSRYLPWSETVSLGITCFVSILAIACPCALGLATPTGIMVGLGLASKQGLLVKNAAALEKFGRIRTIIFDKTGTITQGEPAVTEIITLTATRSEILTLALALENNSEHPLAQAIINLAKTEGLVPQPIKNFQALPGQGVTGEINDQKYWLGNWRLVQAREIKQTNLPNEKITNLEQQGQTLITLGTGQTILGLIAIADKIKPEAATVIEALKKLGIKTIMLSGDREAVAQHIATQAGITEIIADVSPLEKADKITMIKKRDGLTAMVGDGVNDAVALAAADIGLAMATGSDVAIESADLTILHGDLKKIIIALKISRLTMKKIKQNLFWAFFYNIIALPLAAGVFYPRWGILLSPIFAAGAMSLSSVSVVLNTLLMRRAKI